MTRAASVPAEQVDRGLPVRLSAIKDDPHYDAGATGLSDKIDVILDGTVLAHACSWDVVAGVIIRHKRGADGHLVLEKGAPTFETLTGKVEVRWIRDQGGAA